MLRALALSLTLACPAFAAAAEPYTLSAATVDVFDFVELTAAGPPVEQSKPVNPFRVPFTMTATDEAGARTDVAGFADAPTAATFRARFMPAKPGKYTLAAQFPTLNDAPKYSGTFTAVSSKRKGVVKVDPAHPFHFVWSGTGEHFFPNGATAYWLLGNTDDKDITAAIDRFAANGITRVRVALNGRTRGGDRWFEPKVQNTDRFRFALNPWIAARPTDAKDPGLDTTRYDVAFWQKCERMLAHAREKNVAVSVIFHLDGADAGVDPFGGGKKTLAGSDAERDYYRYAAARLSAYSNVMWDVTNEWHLFRSVKWVNDTANALKAADPGGHLITVHGNERFPFRTQPWADYCLYQMWDEGGGYAFMRKNRAEQLKLGAGKPQVNEEYGYEDHYPGKWGGGKKAPARSADNRRRLAWDMTMAGGYQTTGERADTGAGGWITGRGDDTMNLAKLHGHLTAFFTAFDWWKCDPVDGLAGANVRVLAARDDIYAVYAPEGRVVSVRLPAGDYTAKAFDPSTGAWAAPEKVRATAEAAVEFRFRHAGDGAVLFTRTR